MASFATAADMIARYDSRNMGDLLSDTGTRVAEGSMAANDKMAAALSSASGQIVAACLRAKRYTQEQLEALTGESQAYLVDLTCSIAFWLLWRRKPYTEENDQQRSSARKDSLEALELIRKGEHIFDVDEVKDAGIPKIDTVTRVAIKEHNLVVDAARGGNFYPRRRTYANR